MAGTTIQLVLQGVDKASAMLTKVGAEVKSLGETAAKTNAQFSRPVGIVGADLPAKLAVTEQAAVKTAKAFELNRSQLLQLGQILAQSAEKNKSALDQEIDAIQKQADLDKKRLADLAAEAGRRSDDTRLIQAQAEVQKAADTKIAEAKAKFQAENQAREDAASARQQADLQKTLALLEQRRKTELSALAQIGRMRDQIHEAQLSGIQREVAEIQNRYEIEEEKAREILELLGYSQEQVDAFIADLERAKRAEISAANVRSADEQAQNLKQLRDKEAAINRERLQGTQQMFTNMATAAKAFGREGFAAYKAFAIAAAVVDTAQAAISAYKSVVGIPYVGPILAPIAAAAAIAAGAAQIAQIQSQSFASGGYTGAGGKYEVAGPAHKGEYVFPQEVVQRLGVNALDRVRMGGDLRDLPTMRSGPVPRFASGGYAGNPAQSSAGPKVSMALLDKRQDLREWMATEGYRIIVGELRSRGNRISS